MDNQPIASNLGQTQEKEEAYKEYKTFAQFEEDCKHEAQQAEELS
jgi:hypothetical protein